MKAETLDAICSDGVIAEEEWLWGIAMSSAIGPMGGVVLRSDRGDIRTVPLRRWLDEPGPEEAAALDRAVGPVLDVGCGPGRHVIALTRRGVRAVGVERAPSIVRFAHARGAVVLEGSVFGDLPDAGRWRTALLLDGNVGIGGDPVALLTRIRGLLRGDGRILVETEPGLDRITVDTVRVEVEGRSGAWFRWAWVGDGAIGTLATRCGLGLAERWTSGGRTFAKLVAEAP